jgi:hypothetical protein
VPLPLSLMLSSAPSFDPPEARGEELSSPPQAASKSAKDNAVVRARNFPDISNLHVFHFGVEAIHKAGSLHENRIYDLCN